MQYELIFFFYFSFFPLPNGWLLQKIDDFLAVFGNVGKLASLAHELNAHTVFNLELISILLRLPITIAQC